MKRLLGGLLAALLLGVLPFATAQEQPAKQPPAAAPAAAPEPGGMFFRKFDLNKDGKVDWEEFQKVRSGFAGLDADSDGALTPKDFAKLMERNRERMQERMRHRMMRRMMRERFGDGRFGPRGMRERDDGGFDPLSRERQGRRGGMGPRWMEPRGPGGFRPGPRGGGMGPGPRGRGMGWGFGEGDPPEGDEPPPPPRR